MSNRMKEEERIERIIRNLLKLPENRRCINCNSLGTQYVCTTFWTFVCTTCSGVHREFTHRVKSVSMAKFNAEEVSALQAGGNERARQIYFKEWDPQRHSFPDGSNQNRLRDFIKQVYVARKYAGDRGMGKLAMVRADDKEDFSDGYAYEKPSSGGRINDRKSKYFMEERRSPKNKPENVRSGHRNRPALFEVVDDRFRDDGLGSGRRHERNRLSNAESRAGSRSPVSEKRRGKISPPVVRPVSELLGENVPRLQVGGSPKANKRRDTDSSDHCQKTTSPSETVESLEPTIVNLVSLIDFDAEPEPPDLAATSQTQQTVSLIEGGHGASNTPIVNSLDSILFGLSALDAGPVDMSQAPVNIDAESTEPLALSSSVGATAAESTTNKVAASPVGMELALLSSSNDSNVGFVDGQKLPITPQDHLYSSPSGDGISTPPSAGASHNQHWTSSVAPNAQASILSAEKSSQPCSIATQDGLKELPADLFTSSYSSFPVPVPGWHVRPPHGMEFHKQYHPTAAPTPAFPNSPRSRNPFDLDGLEAQVSTFPSILSMQGALPNFQVPSAILHTPNARSAHLMQPQASPYGSIAPQQLPYGMSLTPVSGVFNGHQLQNGMPFSRPQTIHTGREDAFASLNPIQQPSNRYPAPTTPNSVSLAGGNPFG